MNKPNLTKVFSDAQKYLSKHSPEILIGLGITGMITTTVLAVKATPKALKLIEKKKKEEHKDKLTPVETVKTTWKCYIPAVATGVTSAACLIGASSVNARRNAALATAYKLSETAFTEYRDKVVETIGEKKESAVYDKIAQERIEKNPISTSEIIVTEKGNTRFLDGMSGRYFTSDIEKVKKVVNDINNRLLTDFCGYVTLSELYDELNLRHTDISDNIGWRADRGQLKVHYSAQISPEDGVPCIVMNYTNPPEYI